MPTQNNNNKAMTEALFRAIGSNDIEEVAKLLKKGADVDAVDPKGQTPLHQAAATKGGEHMVKLLLERGANIDAVDRFKDTPLHVAARNGHADTARLILDSDPRPDVNAVNGYGQTPLHVAARDERPDITDIQKMLIEKGANLDIPNNRGTTLLMRAMNNGRKDDVNFLVEKGANLDIPDNYGMTLLMSAVDDQREDMVKFLLEKGADANKAGPYNITPLMTAAAAINPNPQIVNLLLKHNANIHAKSDSDLTVIDYTNNQEIKRILVQKALDRAATNNKYSNLG